MKVFFVTFGCKVNTYETGCMAKTFAEKGFTVSDTAEGSDVIVINSCTVTSASDKKVRQSLRKLRHENPDSLIILTGCYPQAFEEEAKKITEADIITGTRNRSEIAGLALNALSSSSRTKEAYIQQYTGHEAFEPMSYDSNERKTRGFIKIQDGCNQFCSYCIIPFARGRIRSKPPEDIASEVTALVKNGYQEIVLVGINLAFYGAEAGLSLTDAVETVSRVEGVKRIRLGSLEPEMISGDDLLKLKNTESFCPQFHLSLQSGCDRTLKAMNRKYTTADYTRLVSSIRNIFPDAAVTTDVMVGFPGETEEDFEESMEFVRKTAFSKIHVFPYSPRSGTKAAAMPDQINSSTKSERAARMTELGHELEREFLRAQVGKTVPVLFEKENCTSFHRGYSPNYTLVKIKREPSIKSLRNSIFYVKIKESMNGFCIGEIIPAEPKG
ncbi:tRNA (N(6)-L-threonylcarbamoyladenosine(37)-C(2))-methylthiotransferase MtaB [Ruminococcus sp. HUN007]|uniref:tRNA (N(6)-L-threonylcarbamoyladenosine(37)-C(2))- methylthiotransferase MtaB n=1 Tax=Ruminococcus sp. HUN007 TaxID=1514668 RepID=UPI0005D18E93|nr:tRNA (N(6)-L-threonylcarbamoyladenosine(37)-C(2))-methylthiotransferase MtaB [Ruminococcus sp. HUN007]